MVSYCYRPCFKNESFDFSVGKLCKKYFKGLGKLKKLGNKNKKGLQTCSCCNFSLKKFSDFRYLNIFNLFTLSKAKSRSRIRS